MRASPSATAGASHVRTTPSSASTASSQRPRAFDDSTSASSSLRRSSRSFCSRSDVGIERLGPVEGHGSSSYRLPRHGVAHTRYVCLASWPCRRLRGSPSEGSTSVLARWLASSWVKPCFCADETLAGASGAFAPLPRHARPQPAPGAAGPGDRAALLAPGPRHRGRRGRRRPGSGSTWSSPRPRPAARASASTCPSCRRCRRRSRRAAPSTFFPTKALARDQEAGLRELMAAPGMRTGAVVYDGDTPGDARRAARERAGIVLTNPDMLHTGILPHHASWARTLQHLRYVVVDELHTYKGVFGSHVANVLRRLVRVAALPRLRPRHPRGHRHHRQPARARRAHVRRAPRARSSSSTRAARRADSAASSSSTRRSSTRSSASARAT